MTEDSSAAAGMSPEEMDVGLAGLSPAPALQPAPPPAIAEAARDVRWLTEKKRVETYRLEYPFVVGGIVVREITVKRLTGGEVAAFTERMRADPDRTWRYPMFYIGDAEIPDAAWDAMDDDDRLALTEIMQGFLPARFRQPTAAAGS